MAQQTPREEFESEMGWITDDQWQWLKEFVQRNVPEREVVGYTVDGRTYHPDDVKVFYEINGQFRTPAEVVKILRFG